MDNMEAIYSELESIKSEFLGDLQFITDQIDGKIDKTISTKLDEAILSIHTEFASSLKDQFDNANILRDRVQLEMNNINYLGEKVADNFEEFLAGRKKAADENIASLLAEINVDLANKVVATASEISDRIIGIQLATYKSEMQQTIAELEKKYEVKVDQMRKATEVYRKGSEKDLQEELSKRLTRKNLVNILLGRKIVE